MTAANTDAKPDAAAEPEHERILIVDDEPFLLDIMRRWLEAEGYDCTVASTGEQAWKCIQREEFALALADIKMPGLSGLDLLAKTKKLRPDTAVIMITAVDDRKTAIHTLHLGAYGYVIKPFERNEVVINVANGLARRRQTQQLRESLKQLEHANLRLVEANRHKSQFLSTMSHELRTPLNAILGYADLLRGQFFGPLNDKQLDYVNHIDDSGVHLLDLINDLLNIAKIDAGAMQLELEPVSPQEFIDATVSMLNSQFRKKQFTVEVTHDPAPTIMAADRRKCMQIMLNLLSNAIKFTPKCGRIDIRSATQGDSAVRIEVQDTGIGIAPEDIDDIFSEFRQADHVRDEQLGGTGIGLALTRRLVELHGGDIGVTSEPGKGSTFWFALPLKKLKSEDTAMQDQDRPSSRGKVRPGRVLVAEDNEVNLAMLLDMLSIQGHEALVARNGQEAVDLALAQKPDLVLMDMRMPMLDGLEATRQIRKAGCADVPIIALTASTGREAEGQQLAAGCTAHLAKPIQVKELFAVLEQHMPAAPRA